MAYDAYRGPVLFTIPPSQAQSMMFRPRVSRSPAAGGCRKFWWGLSLRQHFREVCLLVGSCRLVFAGLFTKILIGHDLYDLGHLNLSFIQLSLPHSAGPWSLDNDFALSTMMCGNATFLNTFCMVFLMVFHIFDHFCMFAVSCWVSNPESESLDCHYVCKSQPGGFCGRCPWSRSVAIRGKR